MKGSFLLLGGMLSLGLGAADMPPLKLEQTVPLPGVTGRLDHLAVDVKGHRLFVAAYEQNTLEVVDLNAGKRIQTVTGMANPQGVLFLADSNRVLVSNPAEATVQILEGSTLKRLKTLYSLLDADNLRYDPKAGQAYVAFGEGAVGLLENDLSGLAKSFKMPGHPESFQLEQNGSRIFVNVPKARQVVVFDRTKRKVSESWGLGDFGENFPMALDEADSRLFVGCRKPARLLVINMNDGKVVTTVPIAQDTDDLYYDGNRKRVYVSCGEGFIDVVQQSSSDKYERMATIETAEGARTSLFSPDLDRYFLAAPASAHHEAQVRIYRPQ